MKCSGWLQKSKKKDRPLKNFVIFISLTCVYLFAQSDINFSYEMKYGDGKNVASQGSANQEIPYQYLENLLDISGAVNPNTSFWAQLEYSDPPIFGVPRNELNSFYIDYQKDNLGLKIGNIYSLYGMGLGINMFQDQGVDFDNSIKGFEISYNLTDEVRLFSILGNGRYEYRTNPVFVEPDRGFDTKLQMVGSEFSLPMLPGYWHLMYIKHEDLLEETTIVSMVSEIEDSRLVRELFSRVDANEINTDFVVRNFSSNLGWGHSLGPFEVYLEGVSSRYTKIFGDYASGTKLYSSVYTDMAGFGITWEYKKYDLPYYIPSVSNPPIAFREFSSPLISRNAHSINFSDESGHQIEVNRSFGDFHFMSNFSFAYRNAGDYFDQEHSFHYEELSDSLDFLVENINNLTDFVDLGWDTEESYKPLPSASISNILAFKTDELNVLGLQPYRQFYSEISGYLMDGKLHFKLGADFMDEVIFYHPQDRFSYNTNGYTETSLQSTLEGFYNPVYEEFWWDQYDLYLDLSFGDTTAANALFEDLNGGNSVTDMINDQTAEAVDISLLEFSVDQDLVYQNDYETQNAITLPTRLGWNFGNGSSITTYFEQQWHTTEIDLNTVTPEGTIVQNNTQKEESYYRYIAMSYNHHGKWSLTLFHDYEHFEKRLAGELWTVGGTGSKDYNAVDLTFTILGSNQLSIFYGSQKGGRVCASGVCADQPDFKDGIKVTFRGIF